MTEVIHLLDEGFSLLFAHDLNSVYTLKVCLDIQKDSILWKAFRDMLVLHHLQHISLQLDHKITQKCADLLVECSCILKETCFYVLLTFPRLIQDLLILLLNIICDLFGLFH